VKDCFNRFSVRFLAVLVLGLALLLLHGISAGPLAGVFAPRCAAPWELSKLAYWPMLAAMALTGGLSGGVGRTLRRAAPWLALTPAALFLTFWLVSRLRPAGGVYLLLWVVAAAVETALAEREERASRIWIPAAIALGALYVILAFFPPAFGPFLDPASAAAMGTIPC